MGVELGQSVLVILAGGKGSRFGEPKGRRLVQGLSLLEWQARRFEEAGGGEALVVFGHHVWATSLPSVVNAFPGRGPFSSLQCGLAAAHPGLRGAVFVLPVDVPAPGTAVWRALADAAAAFDAVVPVHEERGGHPVRLSPRYAAQLREIAWDLPDARLDAQLALLPRERRARVAVGDPAVRYNLNTPEAFAAWEDALDKTAPGSR